MGRVAPDHPARTPRPAALQQLATLHECETYGECNDWPALRAPSPEPFPIFVDRAREEFDADDQSESADEEVAALPVKGLCVVLCACFAAWVVGGLYA